MLKHPSIHFLLHFRQPLESAVTATLAVYAVRNCVLQSFFFFLFMEKLITSAQVQILQSATHQVFLKKKKKTTYNTCYFIYKWNTGKLYFKQVFKFTKVEQIQWSRNPLSRGICVLKDFYFQNFLFYKLLPCVSFLLLVLPLSLIPAPGLHPACSTPGGEDHMTVMRSSGGRAFQLSVCQCSSGILCGAESCLTSDRRAAQPSHASALPGPVSCSGRWG